MLIRLHALLGGLTFATLAAGNASADDKRAEIPDFKRNVLPIFEEKCIRCHGVQRRGGKLDMRSLDAMLTGGVSGPAIKPGNAQKSLLIELIHFNEMPPKKDPPRVTKEELDLLRKWINTMPVPSAISPNPNRQRGLPRS